MSKPTSPFDLLLEKLPVNGNRLASDAATGWGMAGVLLFEETLGYPNNIRGFF